MFILCQSVLTMTRYLMATFVMRRWYVKQNTKCYAMLKCFEEPLYDIIQIFHVIVVNIQEYFPEVLYIELHGCVILPDANGGR